MMALTRGWLAPRLAFRDFGALHREIDGLFDSVLGARPEVPAWAPRVETFTKDEAVHVRLDVPGVDPKAIEVTLDDDVLTIRGERKAEHEDPAPYREVHYGRFERRVRMPDGLDPATITAKYANGVLEVTAPLPKPVNRKIAIDVADGNAPTAA